MAKLLLAETVNLALKVVVVTSALRSLLLLALELTELFVGHLVNHGKFICKLRPAHKVMLVLKRAGRQSTYSS